MTYMQQRYYDPMLGGFLSIDPVTAYEKPVVQFNRYRYANGNPLKFSDPDGRESPCFSNRVGCGLTPITPEIRQQQAVAMTALAGAALLAPAAAFVGGTTIAVATDAAAGTLSGAVAANAPEIVASSLIVAETVSGFASGGGAPSSTVITPAVVEAALAGSTMKTTQKAVSLPVVQNYVERLNAGSAAPAIAVADGVIVEGTHRYVAGRVAGQLPAVRPGTLNPSDASLIQPIQKIKIDTTDWGNR